MNSILILHREAEDTTLMPTPNLDKYSESMLPTFRGSYFRHSDGKEAFRIKDNKITFLRPVTSRQDIDAALELLAKKGVKEILPSYDNDFFIDVHREAYRMFKDKMEVVHPDLLEHREAIEQAFFEREQNQPRRTKGPRIR